MYLCDPKGLWSFSVLPFFRVRIRVILPADVFFRACVGSHTKMSAEILNNSHVPNLFFHKSITIFMKEREELGGKGLH